MRGQDNLHIGVQFQYQFYQPLLPFYVQAHLGLIHKEHVGVVVLHQHGQQDGQHLLLTTRQLIRHQCFANLREPYLVLRPDYLLARFLEQFVHHVLESLLRFRQVLCGIRIALLQFFDNAVAYVHLIVQILALQVIQLEVEG